MPKLNLRAILVLRERRVMLDRDLAALYGVPVKRLNEQVKRNSERFPDDFPFQLTLEEGSAVLDSRSQIATLKRGGNIKYRPYAFTEHGAVMAANVLRSRVAVRARFPQCDGGQLFGILRRQRRPLLRVERKPAPRPLRTNRCAEVWV